MLERESLQKKPEINGDRRGDKNDGGCPVNGRKLGNSPRCFFKAGKSV